MHVAVWLALVLIGYLLIKGLSRWRKEARYRQALDET